MGAGNRGRPEGIAGALGEQTSQLNGRLGIEARIGRPDLVQEAIQRRQLLADRTATGEEHLDLAILHRPTGPVADAPHHVTHNATFCWSRRRRMPSSPLR